MDTTFFYLINHRLHNNVLDPVIVFITNSSYILFIAILTPYFLKDWRKTLVVFSLAALGFFAANGIGEILKYLIARPRPCRTLPDVKLLTVCYKTYGFPSGHSATSFAVASIIGHYCRKAAVPAFLLAVLVAYSRIYVGVHFPSDIIGGALLGGLIGWLIIYLHQVPIERFK